MASKSQYLAAERGAEISDLLAELEKAMDRIKVLYEQYFLGMAKTAPSHLHTELERKMRDVTQMNIRNTALRYRFATITQKFGSYNTYWKRTLREIEQGRYIRNLTKLKRQAEALGGEIPEEILAAMPKRMRDQVRRDREAALAIGARRGATPGRATEASDDGFGEGFGAAIDDALGGLGAGDDVAEVHAPPPPPRPARGQAHRIDEELGDFDVDAMFAAIGAEEAPATKAAPVAKAAPAAPPARVPPVAAPAAPRPPAPPSPPSATRATTPPPMPRAATPPPPPRAATPPPAPRAATPSPLAPPAPRAATPSPLAPPTPRAATPSPVTPPAAAARVLPTAAARPTTPARAPTPPPIAAPPAPPPPGMNDADVRALYTKYAKARELVGEKNDDTTYAKLMKTIQQQAPKIMEQYKSSGVEFGVVIKDNQVILKAKPKP